MLEVTKMMYRTEREDKVGVRRQRRRRRLAPDEFTIKGIRQAARGLMLRNSSSEGQGGKEGGGGGNTGEGEELLPEDIFLPEPRIVQMHTRMKMFRFVVI